MRGETSTPHDRWRLCARTGKALRATAWRFVSPPVAFNPTVLLRRASGRASAAPENDEVKKRTKEKQRPIVPRLSLLFRIALKTPLPQGPEDDFEALQQPNPFITSSDDEKDFSIAQSYFARAQQGCLQNSELPPGGYHEPIGQFTKEEEEKAYHKMFEHIIGKDGLCVYPHCRMPASTKDYGRMLASECYANCFQSNFEEFESNRLRFQDAENDRIMMSTPRRTPVSSPPAPVSPVPAFPIPKKKKRRQNKHKRPATSSLDVPINDNIITDLYNFPPITTHVYGLINDDITSMMTVRSDQTSPCPPSQVAPVPVPGPAPALDPDLDPHLHPLPLSLIHPHSSLPPSLPSLPSSSPITRYIIDEFDPNPPRPITLHFIPGTSFLHPHFHSSPISSSSLNPHVHVDDNDFVNDSGDESGVESGDDHIYY